MIAAPTWGHQLSHEQGMGRWLSKQFVEQPLNTREGWPRKCPGLSARLCELLAVLGWFMIYLHVSRSRVPLPMGPHAAGAANVKPGVHGSYGTSTVTASMLWIVQGPGKRGIEACDKASGVEMDVCWDSTLPHVFKRLMWQKLVISRRASDNR